MATLSYNQLINVFQSIKDSHPQIKRFGNGVIEDVNTFGPNSGEFPILWVAPQSAELGTNSLIYKMRILVFDIDETDDSIRNEILSDTLLILNDVIQMLKNDDDRYSVLGAATATPFNQRFVDYCSGWFCDVDIETEINNTTCSIPTE
jgi:hypothetical protein